MLLGWQGSEPVNGAYRSVARLFIKEGTQRPGHCADQAVVVSREGMVGGEHESPMRVGVGVRLGVEGQEVLDVFGDNGPLQALRGGEEGGIARLAEVVVFLHGYDVVAIRPQRAGNGGREHFVE